MVWYDVENTLNWIRPTQNDHRVTLNKIPNKLLKDAFHVSNMIRFKLILTYCTVSYSAATVVQHNARQPIAKVVTVI